MAALSDRGTIDKTAAFFVGLDVQQSHTAIHILNAAGRCVHKTLFRGSPAEADTIVRWTEDDRLLLSDFLKSTGSTIKQDNSAVTLEVATTCSARVGDTDRSNIQEGVLPHATRAGVSFVAALPRHALTDFVRLGFDELLATERSDTSWSYDGERQFVFRSLSEQFAVFPGQGTPIEKEAAA